MSSSVKHCFVLLFTLRWQGERWRDEEREEKRRRQGQEVSRVTDSFSYRHMLWLLPWVLPSWGAFVSPLPDSLSPDCISRLAAAVYLHLAMSSLRSGWWKEDRQPSLHWLRSATDTRKDELFTFAGWWRIVMSVYWGIWRGKCVPTSPFIPVKLWSPQWHESSILYSWHNHVSRLPAGWREERSSAAASHTN